MSDPQAAADAAKLAQEKNKYPPAIADNYRSLPNVPPPRALGRARLTPFLLVHAVVKDTIGAGGFAKVKIARHKLTGEKVGDARLSRLCGFTFLTAIAHRWPSRS